MLLPPAGIDMLLPPAGIVGIDMLISKMSQSKPGIFTGEGRDGGAGGVDMLVDISPQKEINSRKALFIYKMKNFKMVLSGTKKRLERTEQEGAVQII